MCIDKYLDLLRRFLLSNPTALNERTAYLHSVKTRKVCFDSAVVVVLASGKFNRKL